MVLPPLIVEALVQSGLETIGWYISCRHTSVEKYISMRKIFDLSFSE